MELYTHAVQRQSDITPQGFARLIRHQAHAAGFFIAIHPLSRRNLWALRLCEVIDQHTIWKTLLERALCMPTVTDRIVQ